MIYGRRGGRDSAWGSSARARCADAHSVPTVIGGLSQRDVLAGARRYTCWQMLRADQRRVVKCEARRVAVKFGREILFSVEFVAWALKRRVIREIV